MSDIASIGQHDDLDGLPPPAATAERIGHDEQWRAMLEAEAAGRIHHAWLLQGPRGIGKATFAFAYARHLLTKFPASRTAEELRSRETTAFRQVAQGAHPNLIHIVRPAGERGGFRTQITVDEVRRLNHFFHSTSSTGWRVAIVDPADDLNRSAANALLKILEEPPPRSIFLVVNHSPGALLPTVRSRCRVLRFNALSPAHIRRVLSAFEATAGTEPSQQVIEAAAGSVRSAFLLLQNGGEEIVSKIRELTMAERPDWNAIQAMADSLTLKGREAAFDFAAAAFFDALASEAQACQARNEKDRAAALAALWQREQRRWNEGRAYNLDRKQMMLSSFAGLADLHEGSAGQGG